MEFRMTAITAKDNPSIQLYRKLVRQRKARTQNQQFVLEGYRLVTDAVHFSRKLTHLFLTEAAWERYQEEFCSLEADLRERQPELPEGIPRKARNADRGVRPRNQIAAARADRVGHRHREAHYAVQARFFFATGRAGQILARKAARLHFLSGKLPQAGKQEDSDSGADRRVREPDEELFLRRQQANRRDHDPRGRRTASDQDVRRLSAQPHVQ